MIPTGCASCLTFFVQHVRTSSSLWLEWKHPLKSTEIQNRFSITQLTRTTSLSLVISTRRFTEKKEDVLHGDVIDDSIKMNSYCGSKSADIIQIILYFIAPLQFNAQKELEWFLLVRNLYC